MRVCAVRYNLSTTLCYFWPLQMAIVDYTMVCLSLLGRLHPGWAADVRLGHAVIRVNPAGCVYLTSLVGVPSTFCLLLGSLFTCQECVLCAVRCVLANRAGGVGINLLL